MKNRNNEEITTFDHTEFAQCIANTKKPTGKEYLEECVNFFTTINKINPQEELTQKNTTIKKTRRRN